jgi:uncharacterized membrane protein YhaH (DUF805 family)
MSVSELLFSFSGRTNRAMWWLTGVALSVFMAALFFAGLVLAHQRQGTIALALMLFLIPILWVSLAVGAKRLHDRDMSAWWLLVFYILPSVLQGLAEYSASYWLGLTVTWVVIAVWCIVELGFLRGTAGPNQYGSDPLQA